MSLRTERGRRGKWLLLVGGLILLSGALLAAKSVPAAPVRAVPAVPASAAAVACAPGDQDPYVYRPERLQVLRPCLRITGTVDQMQVEDDGDIHIRVRLDAPYQGLLAGGNQDEGGDLVVEPVCYVLGLRADTMRLCAADPDRVGSIPQTGDHVWMEGRYVLDFGHTAWSELHPLYRWGKASP